MHQPVMVSEVVSLLVTKPGGRFLDCTVGAGSHAAKILETAGPEASLWGIDRDPGRIGQAAGDLFRFGARARMLRGSFEDAARLLPDPDSLFDGILADLGIASDQLDDPDRGFSFQREGPLDMRIDPDGPVTAAELLARLAECDLADLLYKYGEERKSRRIARAIVEARRREPIRTTTQLTALVARAAGGRRGGRIHPATRTFQALRIAVNDELGILERALPRLFDLLKPGGRIAVISFHSLEDRIVKCAFRGWAQAGRAGILTKKPLRPSEEEVRANPRARSAKLRAAESR